MAESQLPSLLKPYIDRCVITLGGYFSNSFAFRLSIKHLHVPTAFPQGTTGETIASGRRSGPKEYPLRMVLEACPDVAHYSRHEIAHWKDFLDTVEKTVRRGFPSDKLRHAWKDAVDAMGEIEAAIVVVAILQRGDMIRSAGGYLRNLTAKARSRTFSAWPMILALLRLASGLPRRGS